MFIRSDRLGLIWFLLALVLSISVISIIGLSAIVEDPGLVASAAVTCDAAHRPKADFACSPQRVKIGETVLCEDKSTDPDGADQIAKWEWDFGDGAKCPPSCGLGTVQNPTHSYSKDGKYKISLVITDKDGCKGIKVFEQMIVKSEYPICRFTWSPASPKINEDVHFSSKDSSDPDGEIIKWEWDFGDGQKSSSPLPVHEYSAEGTYKVTLTVTDDSGLTDTCSARVSVTVEVEGTPVAVLIAGAIAPAQNLRSYSAREFTVHFQEGEKVWLSRLPNGTGKISVHTTLLVEVDHPDGTRAFKEIRFCTLPLCACTELEPLEITSMFEPGKNHVSATLFTECQPALTSTELRLVRLFKSEDPFKTLKGAILRQVAQLRKEAAAHEAAWQTEKVSQLLKKALRYAPRPRRAGAGMALLENAIELISQADLGKLIEQVKRGLPELKGEVEALIKLDSKAEARGKDLLRRLEDLNRYLCGLDPQAPDCQDLLPVTPVDTTWPQLERELTEIRSLLEEALDDFGSYESRQLIREALRLLPQPWAEFHKIAGEIIARLTYLRSQVRPMSAGSSPGVDPGGGELCFSLHGIDAGTTLGFQVSVEGLPVASLMLQLFALDGRLVLERSAEGNHLQFSPLDERGHPLANGVYLYVVTAQLADGTTISSNVRKVMILR